MAVDWLKGLFGPSTPPPTPGQNAKRHLEELAALPAVGRIDEAARRAVDPSTDLEALAAALMPHEHQAVLDRVDGQTGIRLVEAGFQQQSKMPSAPGLTVMGAGNLIFAFKKSAIPEPLQAFVNEHAFEGRINAFRQGRVAVRPEEATEVRRALSKLDKSQLTLLRKVLVEQPPHPDLPKMRKHKALKGKASVDKVMTILSGAPLGLEADAVEGVAPPVFKRIFRPGQAVRVERRGGRIEDGWTIQARNPEGHIVTTNGKGSVKVVDPKRLLTLNPKLLPLETPVTATRSQTKRVDGGWRIVEHRDDGLLGLAKPGWKKPISVADLLATNPRLFEPPEVHGVAAKVFARGQDVRVRRSTGAILEGWKIAQYMSSDAVYCEKDGKYRIQKAEQLLADNPDLMPVGLELNTPRSLGWVEDGWQAFGATDDGRIRMVNARGEWKAIPTEELIELNRDLLLEGGLVEAAKPTGREALAVAGRGLDQAKAFAMYNRIEANQIVHDGYVDGGRGQRIVGGRVIAPREVLTIDRTRDQKLKSMLAWARAIQDRPPKERAQMIARYVYDHFRPTEGNAEDAARRLMDQQKSRAVRIGDAAELGGGGACRHRALLFKVLADEAGLEVALVRGYMRGSSGRYGGHAWNELTLDGEKLMVDVMNPTRGRGRNFKFPALDKARLKHSYMDAAGEELY